MSFNFNKTSIILLDTFAISLTSINYGFLENNSVSLIVNISRWFSSCFQAFLEFLKK